MKESIELLTNPFDGISSKAGFQEKCQDIATELFCNYCIKCGETKYYFAEIEFYYYEKGKWEEEWNKVTYPRNDYNAGDLFYHLSGIDVCFNSVYNDEEAKYGGILIRAIKNAKDQTIVGPLTCKDVILNACKGKDMPRLGKASKERVAKATYRYLGKADFDKIGNGNKDGNLKLAFYDSIIGEDIWNKARSSYYSKRLTT